jgi:hypothetical protein
VGSAVDPSPLLPDLAFPTSPLNMAISVDGYSLDFGSATASSGTDDFAVAIGADSHAGAGDTVNPGTSDFAFADGAGSDAGAGIGDSNVAVAYGDDSFASSGSGQGDFAYSDGSNSTAVAGGLYDTTNGVGYEVALGNNDFASAIGTGDNAESGAGVLNVYDLTTSNGDIASIVGNSSDAYSGEGNTDLAAVFGDMYTATAAPGSDLIDIEPFGTYLSSLVDGMFGI